MSTWKKYSISETLVWESWGGGGGEHVPSTEARAWRSLPRPLSNSDRRESTPPKLPRLPAARQPCAPLVMFQSRGLGPGFSTLEFQGALRPQISHRKGTEAAAPDGGRKL